ncbi:MAG: hypothetical protein WC976_05935 [Caldisericia bacterium]
MQLKFKITYIIIVLLAHVSVYETANAGILRNAILLSEERTGKEIRYLPQQGQNARVDINSTIHVNLSSAVLNSSQFMFESAPIDVTTEIQSKGIKGLIDGMNVWTRGLAQGWEEAQKLTDTPKGTAEYKRLIKRTNDNYNIFYNGYEQYEKALREMPEGKERADALRSAINAALDQGPIALPRVLQLFNAEIEWLNAQIKEITRQALENGNTLGIKMNACFIQKGQNIPMHLPGYDNYVSGIPEPYEKLRFEPNEQDKKALSEINAKTSELADNLREVKSLQEGLKIFGKQVLGENYIKLENATNELTNSITALRSIDWEAKKKQVEAESQIDLSNLKTEVANEYQEIISTLTYLVGTCNDLTTNLDKLSSPINLVQSNLESIKILRQQNNAAEALIVLLNLASQNKTVFIKALDTVSEIKVSLDSVSTLKNELKVKENTLPETLKIKAAIIIDKTTKPEILQIVKSVNDFKDAINSLLQANDDVPSEIRAQLKGASGIDLSDVASVNLIPLNSAGETMINIQEAKGREENDRIRLHAVIYKMKKVPGENGFITDGNPLDEYDAYFELTKYGWYTSPGGGVVFISRVKDAPGVTPIRGQSSPAATWMLHYRSWPKNTNDDGFSEGIMGVLKPGFGFHTSTLHFDSAKGIEVGTGFTFTLLNDLIQCGYGWNINATENKDYWYIGFGILKFGNGLGIK